MRRPLKPFVTEYKGSRRGASSFGDTPSFDSERPGPKIAEAKLNADTESDDSYEAAMRAADALFASPADPESKPDRPPPRLVADSPQHDADEPARQPERGGGRILRAIDDAPPPQFAAREAELAPRRRGRKPGSKNKPKVVEAAPADGRAELPGFAQATPVAAPIPAAALPVAVTAKRIVALSTGSTPGRTEKKFAWVRDRLKPGEDWKRRRLPRVCW